MQLYKSNKNGIGFQLNEIITENVYYQLPEDIKKYFEAENNIVKDTDFLTRQERINNDILPADPELEFGYPKVNPTDSIITPY